jgi:predicted secreted protein
MKKIILIAMVLVFGLVIKQVKADFTFSEPMKVGPPVNSSFTDATPCISADGLNLYFTSNRPGGRGSLDLWMATFNSLDQSWSEPVNLGMPVNTSAYEGFPSISTDGLSLYFASNQPGSLGGSDIWMTTRSTIEANWSKPVNLGPNVNSSSEEISCCISPNGTELFISSNRPGGMGSYDLYVARRAATDQSWSAPVNLGSPVNGSAADGGISLSVSNNSLMLFIHSDRVGGFGGHDLYWTSLRPIDDVWSEPVNLGSIINTYAMELRPSLAKDARVLYYGGSYMDLGSDIWQAPILPIVDFNGDGIVDASDMCIMVDHWEEDYSLCDIGPTPLGDGIVGVQDLIVLAEHLFEVYPSAETVDVNEADDGGQIELELGTLLVVTLESNPSTGYRWEVTENNDSVLKQFGQTEYKPAETSEPPLVGAGGWEIFRFKAVSAGHTTLELVYRRPWEDAEPLKIFSIQVTVS